MTFSADKSVSALWAIADDRLRTSIEEAHNNAARMALKEIFLKECSYTRTREGGAKGDIRVLPAHMLGAMFQHGTSRADDPQLHTHCVIFNAVQTETDGKWRALHQKPMYLWIKAAGACYRSYLASHLAELGIQIERYGKDNAYVRITNIPEDLEKTWSKRRSNIVEAATQMGFETGDNSNRAEMLRVKTREAKRCDQTPEQRHARWREECEQLYECATILASVFDEPETLTQDRIRQWAESLDDLPHELTRLQAVFRTPDLAEAIYNLHDPSLGTLHPETIETAIQRVIRNQELVALDQEPRTAESIAGLSHTVPLSTRHTLQMENETRDIAQSMSQQPTFALPADAIEAKLDELIAEDYPLSDEQTDAIRYVTGRTGAISIIEGAAGSGKTTTIRPIVDLYKAHGYNFIGTSIAWRTAVELANDCDITPLATDKLLKLASKNRLHLDNKSVIVVEEAGMLSTRHTHRILKLAQEHGAKVVLLGDTQQQQPSEAGPGLRLVHDVTGSHRVDTIRRQKADAEDVLRDIHGLDADDAIEQAARLDSSEQDRLLAELAHIEHTDHLVPWQITASRDFKDGNAKDAIAAYRRRDRIHFRTTPESTVNKLVDHWHQFVTEHPDKSCVVLARTHQEIKLLSLQMRERLHADQKNPKSAVVKVSRGEGKQREYYDLEIRTGDRLRVGASQLDRKIYTGSLLTVEDLSVRGAPTHHEPRVFITARDDRGRRVSFYHDEIRDYHGNIRLDHGFALTMTSAQGLTVDRAFVLADDAPSRETIYPASTRHRERLDLYISRDGPLNRIKVNLPDQGADLKEVITDEDILDHLAKRWSRHQPKEAATDYTSEELMQETLESLTRRTPPPPRPPQEEQLHEAPSNDNTHSLLSWATRQLRQTALDLRYGHTIAMISQGRQEVMASYQNLRERGRKEGGLVALSPEFNNTLFRQAQVLSAADPFRRDPEKFRDLLQRRGSLDVQDLEDFAAQYALAKNAQRAAADTRNQETAPASLSPDGGESPEPPLHTQSTPELETKRQSRSLPRAAELSAALSVRAEDVCQHYLPHGRQEDHVWHAEPALPKQSQTLRIHLAGPNRGKWTDPATGARGDLLDLIRHTNGYSTIAEAMKEATTFLDAPTAAQALQPPSASADELSQAHSQRVQALYDRARPISQEDPAALYLDKLGVDISDVAELRYHERVYYLHHDDLRQAPAILAPVRTPEGRLQELERILLTKGGDALPVDPHATRSHSSVPAGAAVRFGRADAPRLAVCETVPEALSVLRALDRQERDQLAILAAPARGDLLALAVPPHVRELTIVQGSSPEADENWQALRHKHEDTQLRLHRILTEDSDLNTILREDGPDALRNVLEPLTQPDADRADLAALQELQGQWQNHITTAQAALVEPFYMPEHDDLVDRLKELRDRPAIAALPPERLARLDVALAYNSRQREALAHVHKHLAHVERCRNQLDHLNDIASRYELPVQQVHTYDVWHDTAQRLLADGENIIGDHGTYGPCLEHNPGVWTDVHAGIRELAVALGHDRTSLQQRQPELFLIPVTRSLPNSQEAIEADASYRRLREQWHNHLDIADATQAHPYDMRDHAPLIDGMRALRDQPHLAGSARDALESLVENHDHYGNARGEVASYLTDVEEVIREQRQRVRIRSEYAARNVLLNDESFYAEWTPKAQKRAVAGQTILGDPASSAGC
ncbi:MAG: relaxase domain-containing protein, partial [Chloroflexi bacterium]|nr:relaxase domain-containing protein [Chloroflexota bacterium]